MKTPLQTSDPKIYELIEAELGRRRKGLEMIPSENHTSLAVLAALGILGAGFLLTTVPILQNIVAGIVLFVWK